MLAPDSMGGYVGLPVKARRVDAGPDVSAALADVPAEPGKPGHDDLGRAVGVRETAGRPPRIRRPSSFCLARIGSGVIPEHWPT